jgi:ubiquinone/menaquinone biosynthesis C-methylase UbiE
LRHRGTVPADDHTEVSCLGPDGEPCKREGPAMSEAGGGTGAASPVEVYALGTNPAESARLQQQADELRPYSEALLDRARLGPGQTAIDLGCGPRGVLDLMSERVAPGGRVVGVDADPNHVAMAGRFVADHGLDNVEVVLGDARDTGLDSAAFDLVHCRTLLVTVPEPDAVMAEMVRLAKPNGGVVSLEPDVGLSVYYPPTATFDRLEELFYAAFRRNGADPTIGRRLTELYRQAGLDEIGTEALAPVHPAGDTRRTIRLDLVRSMRPMIIEAGLADEDELLELDRTGREQLADPDMVVMPSLLFTAWGRRPSSPT